MKAILVIDMPNTCSECKLFWNDVDCGCMALERVFGEFGCSVGKPVDCPLKPMPQRFESPILTDYCLGSADGWNCCIETILGEENE